MINFASVGTTIADIAVICVFIISIAAGFRKGLTAMLFRLICLAITVIAVIALCKPITNWVYDHTGIDEFFSERIESTIGDFLEKQIEENGKIDSSKTNLPESIVDKINQYITEAETKSTNNISKFVADKLSYVVISAIVVILLCIVIRIAASFLRVVLMFLTHLPIIYSIDKIGGIVYGLIRAYIIVYFVLAVFSLLSPLWADTGLIAAINNSSICSKFYNNNIFLKILLK
jgi:hypothetical protein